MVFNFRTLTDPQQRVLGAIAINCDQGHDARVLASLEKLGLIAGRFETLPGWPPVNVRRWVMPLRVHIEWCAFCASLFESGELKEPV